MKGKFLNIIFLMTIFVNFQIQPQHSQKDKFTLPSCEFNINITDSSNFITTSDGSETNESIYLIKDFELNCTYLDIPIPGAFVVFESRLSPLFQGLFDGVKRKAIWGNFCEGYVGLEVITDYINQKEDLNEKNRKYSQSMDIAFPGTYKFLYTLIYLPKDKIDYYFNYGNRREAELYNFGVVYPKEYIIMQKTVTHNIERNGEEKVFELESYSESFLDGSKDLLKSRSAYNLEEANNIFKDGCKAAHSGNSQYFPEFYSDTSGNTSPTNIPSIVNTITPTPSPVDDKPNFETICTDLSEQENSWQKIIDFFIPPAVAREPGTFETGQCTQYAADRRQDAYKWLPDSNADAKNWDDYAKKAGIPVDHTPQIEDIVVWEANCGPAYGDGHVAIIDEVKTNMIVVSQMNVPTKNVYSQKEYPILDEKCMSFIHKLPEETVTTSENTPANQVDEPSKNILIRFTDWISSLWTNMFGK